MRRAFSVVSLSVLVFLFSVFLAWLLRVGYGGGFLRVSFSGFEGSSAAFLDAGCFVLMVCFVGYMVYLAVKHGRLLAVRAVSVLVYGFMAYVFSLFYFPVLLWFAGLLEHLTFQSFQLLRLLMVAGAVYVVFAVGGLAREVLAFILATGFGVLVGFNLQTLNLILMAVFMSGFDVYTVEKGYLRKLSNVESGDVVFESFTLTCRGVSVGLGDIFFYSALTSHLYVFFSLEMFLVCLLLMFFGVLLTARFAERRGMFPGLPLVTVPPAVLLFLSLYL